MHDIWLVIHEHLHQFDHSLDGSKVRWRISLLHSHMAAAVARE